MNTTINLTKYSRILRQLTQKCYTVLYVEKRAGKGKKRKAADVNHGEDYVEDEDNEENEELKGKKRLRRSPGSTAETFETYVEER